MAGSLDFLWSGTPPASVTGNLASITSVPDWYQEYLRGIAGQATSLAGINANEAVPAQSVAGFTPDQIAAFQGVRDNQGSWQPYLGMQGQTLGNVGQNVNGAIQQANAAAGQQIGSAAQSSLPYLNSAMSAAGGPAAKWTDNFSQYMSPYTSAVVDNIGRLGQENFNENIMPGVNRSMIGAGQFGSTRNAQILSDAARKASMDITGQQAQALEQGYGTAAGIFAGDANRAAQQQQLAAQTGLTAGSTYGTLSAEDAGRQLSQNQLQANTALTGGQLAGSTGLSTAQQYGALGAATSGLGLADAQALAATGQQQQGLNQQGLDTAYTNAMNLNNWDWNILNNLNSVVRGAQLPTTTTQTSNNPVGGYTASPLATVGGVYSWLSGSK